MPNDSTASAAEALLAYRRGEVQPESPFRDLSKRVAQALGSFDSVDPRTAADARFLAVALDAAAARDTEVRDLVRTLAAAVERAKEVAAERGVSVRFRGDNNSVVAAGRDVNYHGGAPTASSQGHAEPEATPIDVLFAAASPDDLGRLRVDQEARTIRETLERSPHGARIRLHERTAVRGQDLTEALLRLRPRVVHFSGHGSAGAGELYFENEMGCSMPVTADALRAIFSPLAGTVECVVMNACYARGNAAALLESVPCVIGTDGPVSDEMAITFSTGFYQALGAGEAVPEAYEWGCGLVKLMRVQGETPRLDTRAR